MENTEEKKLKVLYELQSNLIDEYLIYLESLITGDTKEEYDRGVQDCIDYLENQKLER